MVSFLQIFGQRFFTPSHSLHSHYMPCPFSYTLFDNPNTNLKGTHRVGGLYRDRKMSLDYILEKLLTLKWTALRYGPVTVSCEHGYETWGPIHSNNSWLDGRILTPQEDIGSINLTVWEGSRVGCNETKISTKTGREKLLATVYIYTTRQNAT